MYTVSKKKTTQKQTNKKPPHILFSSYKGKKFIYTVKKKKI